VAQAVVRARVQAPAAVLEWVEEAAAGAPAVAARVGARVQVVQGLVGELAAVAAPAEAVELALAGAEPGLAEVAEVPVRVAALAAEVPVAGQV
jgi:hypothetical protein